MMPDLAGLEVHLRGLGRCAVAFSGGVDSTFLAAAAFRALGSGALAITADTPYMPRREIEEAADLAERIGIRHRVLRFPLPGEIRENPPDRCYLCKKILFGRLAASARADGAGILVDGTNADDAGEHRPGRKALIELGIRSPLLELGFGKDRIRLLSKDLGLPTWDKPAYACLLTRLPYGALAKDEDLGRIEDAEYWLRSRGFGGARVRSHGGLARIEVAPPERKRFAEGNLLDEAAAEFERLGFSYAALDLGGYKTGKMDKKQCETKP